MSDQPEDQEEFYVDAQEVFVSEQPIELYKVLKLGNLVNGGGEAKMAIAQGYVGLNSEIELRKRCKVYDGDVISFNDEYLVLICDQTKSEALQLQEEAPVLTGDKDSVQMASSAAAKEKTRKSKSKSKKVAKNTVGSEDTRSPITKRRSISF